MTKELSDFFKIISEGKKKSVKEQTENESLFRKEKTKRAERERSKEITTIRKITFCKRRKRKTTYWKWIRYRVIWYWRIR